MDANSPSGQVQTFRNLDAWKQAVELVVVIYRVSDGFSRGEIFGLTSQLRRAAISIPGNIAEGNSRPSVPAYINHLGVALGSLGEVRSLIEVATRLAFLCSPDTESVSKQVDRVGSLVFRLRESLKSRSRSPY